MNLSIRDLGAIQRLDIEMPGPITLICGHNEAGKSTTARALAAALAGAVLPQKFLKKQAGLLVRSGEQSSQIIVKAADWSATVTYPDCQRVTSGEAPAMSMMAAGVDDFLEMATEQRARYLGELLKATPSADDLLPHLADIGCTEGEVKALIAKLSDGDNAVWDSGAKAYDEIATKARGAWEQISGERFGSAKAAAWRPATYTDDLSAITEDDLQRAVHDAEVNYRRKVGEAAVYAEKRGALIAEADQVEALTQQVAAAKAALETAQANHAEALKKLMDSPVPQDHAKHACPLCNGALAVKQDHASGDIYLRRPAAMSGKESDAYHSTYIQIEGIVARAKSAVNAAQKEWQALTLRLDHAVRAKDELARMPVSESIDRETVDAAIDALDAAKTRLSAHSAYHRATGKYREHHKATQLSDLLGPEGVRKVKLHRVLEAFDRMHLEARCDAAGWPRVEIQPDFSVTYGGRPLSIVSASAQWRVRAVLRSAFGALDGSHMIILDAADILDAKGKSGLLKMVTSFKQNAMICMTLAGPDKTPGLKAAGMGRAYWIADGVATEIGD